MYTIDYTRMATLGKATELQRSAHRAVLDVNRKMIEALRPGVKCSDLHRLALKAIEEAGGTVDRPEKLRRGRMGHGQGMLVTEPPSITARR
jgi:Xaa-Pro aminopeptidase